MSNDDMTPPGDDMTKEERIIDLLLSDIGLDFKTPVPIGVVAVYLSQETNIFLRRLLNVAASDWNNLETIADFFDMQPSQVEEVIAKGYAAMDSDDALIAEVARAMIIRIKATFGNDSHEHISAKDCHEVLANDSDAQGLIMKNQKFAVSAIKHLHRALATACIMTRVDPSYQPPERPPNEEEERRIRKLSNLYDVTIDVIIGGVQRMAEKRKNESS